MKTRDEDDAPITPERDMALRDLAQKVATHLSREDALLVGTTITRHPQRYIDFMRLHAGKRLTAREWASVHLRFVKHIQAGAPS